MKFFIRKSLLCVTAALASYSTLANESISFTYNSAGQILTEDGPRTDVNDITTHSYDAQGNRATSTNALNQTVRYNSYDASGKLLSVTDPNNVTTEFTYHPNRGWLLSSRLKSSDVNTADAVTQYDYDEVGQLISVTLPTGTQLDFEYDDARRLTAIKNAAGERIEYALDAAGNRTQETIKDSSATIRYSVNRAYDELSRVITITGNSSQVTQQQYDANDNPTLAINGRSFQTEQQYDALNRVAKIIDPYLKETKFTYDSQHRVQSVMDARGKITTYNYDGLGYLISQVSPDTGITTLLYDSAGNRIRATDARGVVTNYAYDALNRLKSINYPAAPVEKVSFSYDDIATGTWGANYGVGRLTRVVNAAANTAYKYNEAGLIKNKRTILNNLTFSTSYTYSKAGDLTSIIYPSGRVVNYQRDNSGRVSAITTQLNSTAATTNVVTDIRYLPFGPANRYSFGNGLSHNASYDLDYRLTGITVGGILSRNYQYDLADNITRINNLVASNKSQTFSYDRVDRLTKAVGVYGTFNYSYDAVGNRLSESTATQAAPTIITTNKYTYLTSSNRLTSITKTVGTTASGTRSFSYDAAGNRTQSTTEENKLQTYTYNNANRLDTAKVASAVVGSYAYDAFGQRVSKTLATGSKELYHYDEAGQLIAVTDGNGATLREYIYNGNQLAGFVTTAAAPIAPISLYGTNATLQGSVSKATTQTGYLGTGYLKFNGEGQATWPLKILTTANYTISIRHSLASPNRPLALLVDGVQKATVNFTTTADWNTWAYAKVTLNLPAGTHTFSLKTTGSGGPNIDKISVTPVAGQAGPQVATLFYVHNDHLGTPQVVTNQAQQVVFMADYQPFGKLQPGQTNSIELYSRFPGQFSDTETGLYYNYFRDYDPSIGRYIESDPIGLSGGINTYAYVGGNPINFTDPFGLKKWDWNGWGNTAMCSYYDDLAKKSGCKYYEEAAKICRGEHAGVNRMLQGGITQAWMSDSTSASQADIANQIRADLISGDKIARALNNRDSSSPRGDHIDQYHNQAFKNAGINTIWYGGNVMPQGIWPNVVPYDPIGNPYYDPRNPLLPPGGECGCSQ